MTIKQIRSKMHRQIRKAIFNGLVAFLVITFGDSIWNAPVITIPLFLAFLILTTINFAKIDYLNEAIRSRKSYPEFYRQDPDEKRGRENTGK